MRKKKRRIGLTRRTDRSETVVGPFNSSGIMLSYGNISSEEEAPEPQSALILKTTSPIPFWRVSIGLPKAYWPKIFVSRYDPPSSQFLASYHGI